IYNAAGELATMDTGAAHLEYSYDYGLDNDESMLSITRTRTRSSPSIRQIEVDYDARVASIVSFVPDSQTLIEKFLWYPFASGHLEVWTQPAPVLQPPNFVARAENFLDVLGGPLLSLTPDPEGDNSEWFEQATVVDKFRETSLFEPEPLHGLGDNEYFHL